MLAFIHCSDQLKVANSFNDPESLVTPVRFVVVVVAKVGFCEPAALVAPPWHPAFPRGEMYKATVRSVLFYRCET